MSYNSLRVGQVLWLKVRYQKNVVSKVNHPMLISSIKNKIVEVIALDKASGKLENLYRDCNFFINSQIPKESVIYEDSYAQLNTRISLENCDILCNARKTFDLLSREKLEYVIYEYNLYQKENGVNQKRNIFMSRYDILKLNPSLAKRLVVFQ